MAIKFKIGDRVEYIGSDRSFNGLRGTVRVEDESPGIEFDQGNAKGHSLGGRLEWNRGWYCDASHLKLLQPKKIKWL